MAAFRVQLMDNIPGRARTLRKVVNCRNVMLPIRAEVYHLSSCLSVDKARIVSQHLLGNKHVKFPAGRHLLYIFGRVSHAINIQHIYNINKHSIVYNSAIYPMPPLLLPLLALPLTAALALWLWHRFVRHEVAENAAMILANGSADDLRKGFHQRRSWIRFWPWLGLSVCAALPGLWGNYWCFPFAFAAVGLLLLGYFARWFTPWLNLAMKLDYKPEYYASPDSASWPDAAVWVKVRNLHFATDAARQAAANDRLRALLDRTWLLCRIGAGVLATGAVASSLLLNH